MPTNRSVKECITKHKKWLNTLRHTQRIDQVINLAADEVYHRLLMISPTHKWDKREIKDQLNQVTESYTRNTLRNGVNINYQGDPYDLITKHSSISSSLEFVHYEQFTFPINHGYITTMLSVYAPVPAGDIQTLKDIGVIKTVYSEPSSYTEVSCDYPSNDIPF